MDYRSDEIIDLTEAIQPLTMRWSPDGKRIAFRSRLFGDQNRENIYIFDISGARFVEIPRKILPPSCASANLEWTPDGEHIVLTCRQDDETGNTQIVLAATDGSHEYRFLPFDIHVPCKWFGFSPDGAQIVCGDSSEEEDQVTVAIVDIQNGETNIIYSTEYYFIDEILVDEALIANRHVTGVYFLDDEQILLKYSWIDNDFAVIDLTGEILQQATLSSEWVSDVTNASPAPDGSKVAFNANNIHLASFDFDTEEVEILYTDEDGDWVAFPDWSPLLDEPLDLPDEPYTLEYLCGLLEESGGYCSEDLFTENDSNSD